MSVVSYPSSVISSILKMHIQCIVGTFWILFTQIYANKFNVLYTELQFCKEYDVKSGYKYSSFFHIDSLKPNRKLNKTDDEILNLRIYVLAMRDAHILLSATDQIKSSPIYEIVLGAGGNTFNEIRRQRQKDPLKTIKVRRFLSPTDVMPLTIRILKTGNISVAITGQEPFIVAFDKNVLDVKYLSFSTWGDSEAKWFYDCENNDNGDHLTPIEPISNDYQRLQDFLLTDRDYDSNTIHDLNALMFDFDLSNANFNAKESSMESRGQFRASWIDSRLIWNVSDFGGLASFRFKFDKMVWTPQIRLLNGKDENFVRVPLTYNVEAFSDGSMWAETNEMTISTWCWNFEQNWPHETIDCDIQIQLDHFANLQLFPLTNSIRIVPKLPESFNYDGSQWHIISASKTYLAQTEADNPYVVTDEQILPVAYVFKIDIGLQRNIAFYHYLIGVPLIGAFSLLLLSFWVERLIRFVLNVICLIMMSVMLLILVDHAPNSYAPTIVTYYVCSFYLTCFSLFALTLRCWFNEYKPNIELLTRLASSKFAQILFVTDIYEYTYIEDESMYDFSKVVDRFLFLLYFMLFVICAAIGYN